MTAGSGKGFYIPFLSRLEEIKSRGRWGRESGAM